jgi:hypothetical protein
MLCSPSARASPLRPRELASRAAARPARQTPAKTWQDKALLFNGTPSFGTLLQCLELPAWANAELDLAQSPAGTRHGARSGSPCTSFTLGSVGRFDDNMTGGRGFIGLAAMIFGR